MHLSGRIQKLLDDQLQNIDVYFTIDLNFKPSDCAVTHLYLQATLHQLKINAKNVKLSYIGDCIVRKTGM